MRDFPELIPAQGGSEQERFQNWQNHLQELERFARETTKETLLTDRTVDGLAKLHRTLTDLEEQALAAVLKPLDKLPEEQRVKMLPQCKMGCSHCCHQEVTVNIPEVVAVYRHIMMTCDPEMIESYRKGARRYREHIDALERGARQNVPCPLLVNDICSIYGVRPIVCRGYTSLSAKRCEQRQFDKYNELKVTVPVILPLRNVSHAITCGLYRGLEAMRMPPYEVSLGLALHVVFEDLEACEKYLAGEDVFLPARVAPAEPRPA